MQAFGGRKDHVGALRLRIDGQSTSCRTGIPNDRHVATQSAAMGSHAEGPKASPTSSSTTGRRSTPFWIVSLFETGETLHVDCAEIRMCGNEMYDIPQPKPFTERNI